MNYWPTDWPFASISSSNVIKYKHLKIFGIGQYIASVLRQGDLDGRRNLSEKALQEFTQWFLEVCLDQVEFMSAQFELNRLDARYERFVAGHDTLKPESSALLKEALRCGQFERGQAPRITGLPARTAQRVLQDVIAEGLLTSTTPKGAVSLRFPTSTLESLFPRLYPEA